MRSELVSPYRLTLGDEPVETFDDRLEIVPDLGTESDEVGKPADCSRNPLERVRENRDFD